MIKLLLFFVCAGFLVPGFSQNLQLHYDVRHSIDNSSASSNYPSFSFEFFKEIDTAGTGSFLLKRPGFQSGLAIAAFLEAESVYFV